MIKTLMHKDVPVVSMKISTTGAMEEIVKVFNEELLPENDGNIAGSMMKWLLMRNIPTTRKDVKPLREFYGSKMFMSANARSLADTYWLKISANDSWDSVNAFDNWDPADDDILLALIYPEDFQTARYDSPNLTMPGAKPSIWYRDETHPLGTLCLDAQAEMARYKIAKENNIQCVKHRSYFIRNKTIYTYTRANTSKDIEEISLKSLLARTKDATLSEKENLQKCCETFKIPKWREFVNEMLRFNKLCGESIEMPDIKVLRDTETLKILGFEKL